MKNTYPLGSIASIFGGSGIFRAENNCLINAVDSLLCKTLPVLVRNSPRCLPLNGCWRTG